MMNTDLVSNQKTITIDQAWGRGELMVVAAFRYCLGRQTYIVGACVEWLIAGWRLFQENTRFVIERDLREAFEEDNRRIARGAEYPKPLGAKMDRARWQELLDFIEQQRVKI